MKYLSILFSILLSSAALAATPVAAPAPAAAPANPHAGMSMQGGMPMQGGAQHTIELSETAKVVSTINVPQYTYIEVSQGTKTHWLATATTKVKKGDTIRFDKGMEMTNFHSNSLNRTFPSIAFVNRVAVGKAK